MSNLTNADLIGNKASAIDAMVRAGTYLTASDVDQILLVTSNKAPLSAVGSDPVNGAANVDGGGMAYSNTRSVDAFEALRFAEVWNELYRGNHTVTSSSYENLAVDTYGPIVNQTMLIKSDATVSRVEIYYPTQGVDITNLQFFLTSPSGTQVRVTDPAITYVDRDREGYTFTLDSEVFLGESAKGAWRVTAYGPAGTRDLIEHVGAATLIINGTEQTANDVYHYTNEFPSVAALDPSRTVLKDTDGGIDWVNLAGQTGDVRLDLRAGGQTSVDGETMFRILPVESGVKIQGDVRTVIVDTIENAVTGDGNDTLSGNSLDNKLMGMRGNDRFVSDAGADILDGGEGIDTVTYAASAGVGVDLQAQFQSGGDAQGDRLFSIENVTGSGYADAISGDASANVLLGLAGDDVLKGRGGDDRLDGGAGDDILHGGQGADTLIGGTGFDTVSYAESSERVIINLATGVQSSGDAEGDTFGSVEAFIGSAFNDRFNGSDGADRFSGGAGNDVFVGSEGADVIDGGSGVDAMLYTSSRAAVNVDLLLGTASGGQAQGDVLTGIEDLKGSKYADVLIGNGGANSLEGGAGDDRIDGGRGMDILTGGLGNDTLTGGTAADTFNFDAFGFGRDTITDFSQVAGDRIDFSGLGIGFGDLVISTSSQGTAITFAANIGTGGDSIFLAGQKGAMSLSDFDFA